MGRLNQLAVSPAVTHLAAFASALPGGLARPWKRANPSAPFRRAPSFLRDTPSLLSLQVGSQLFLARDAAAEVCYA